MKLSDLYQHSIRYGAALDVRGPQGLQRALEARRREYESLPTHEREAFDLERLSNPFGDVRLAYTPRPASEIEIGTILLGIDIGVAELLLAGHLRRKGVPGDAVVAHHTPNAGVAFNLAQDIMGVNVEMLVAQGVPEEDARLVIDPYVHERWLGNDPRGPSAARLFNRLVSRLPLPNGRPLQHLRLPLLTPHAATDERPDSALDAAPLYAGETVARIHDIRPAAELVKELL